MELDLGSLVLSDQPTDNDPAADNRANLAASAYCLLRIENLEPPNLKTPNLDDWEWHSCSTLEHTQDNKISKFAKEALEEKEGDDHNNDDGINPSTLSRFQRLPGEIRQLIYDYVFAETYGALIKRDEISKRYRHNKWNKYNKWDKYNKRAKYATKYKLTQRYSFFNRYDLPSMDRLPLGLVFSCKTFYNETLLYLYERTCFTFDTTKALRRFLRKVSPGAKAVIQHVQLKHEIHNETHDKSNEKWQLKSNAAWKSACQRMAKDLTSLRHLYIEATVYPGTALTMDEPWCEPYLSFCGPDGKGRLECVQAWVQILVGVNTPADRLSMYRNTYSARLHAAGLELERRLMTDDAFEKKKLADPGERRGDVTEGCKIQ